MLSQTLSLFSDAAEVLFPKECLVCRRPLRRANLCFRCTPVLPELRGALSMCCQRCFGPITPSNKNICDTCTSYPPATDQMRFIWDYSGLARDFIRTMKYRPSVSLARTGGGYLATLLPQIFDLYSERWDLIVPIPSSHETYKARLFNPCDEMSLQLSKQLLHLPVTRALVHEKRRKPQALSSHEERMRGLKKLFAVQAPSRGLLAGARVLLVEDVITTGATMVAAAHALREHKVASVDVIALARTRVWLRFRRRLWELLPPTKALAK
jgi:ComF family protein